MGRVHFVVLVVLIFAGLGLASLEVGGAAAVPESRGATVVYLVRHAETDPDVGPNPPLTEAGVAWAARLADLVRDEPISAVFVTATIRSHATAAPVLWRFNLDATEYSPRGFAALGARIREGHTGERVVVVAHSNTVAPILRALGGPETPDLEHDEYDRLYAVVMEPGGAVRTLSLRF